MGPVPRQAAWRTATFPESATPNTLEAHVVQWSLYSAVVPGACFFANDHITVDGIGHKGEPLDDFDKLAGNRFIRQSTHTRIWRSTANTSRNPPRGLFRGHPLRRNGDDHPIGRPTPTMGRAQCPAPDAHLVISPNVSNHGKFQQHGRAGRVGGLVVEPLLQEQADRPAQPRDSGFSECAHSAGLPQQPARSRTNRRFSIHRGWRHRRSGRFSAR